ncbi:hypothetical protein [Bauldia litoralis]|uniref:hypothetical protein n=1 Tax=Bauldia litoralis TaxID=665467 RepID=UPI003264AF27
MIRFDPHRRAASPELKAAVRALASFLEQREGRKRCRTEREHAVHRLAADAVACNLIAASLIGPGTSVAIERGHDAMFGHARYRSPVYGRHFVTILDTMLDAKLITATTGFRVSPQIRKASTIRATAALAQHLPLGTSRADWQSIKRDVADEEVLILKGTKGAKGEAPLLDYADTPETARLRRQVQKLNARLAKAPITILATTDSLGRPIDPTQCTLTRIFNNGRWDEGGRIGNGAFWTGMTRDDRFNLIRIDGERIASADFAQCQPRILFALSGADQPNGDLYDFGDGHRRGWQQLIVASLFARKPLGSWPFGCRENFEPDPPHLRDAIAEIEFRLAPIADYLGTGIGHRLAKIEGDMILRATEALLRQRVVALPVYDCLYVARRHVEAARDAMQAAADRLAGGVVKIDLGPEEE